MCSLFTVILFISNPLISLLVHLVTPHWRELPRSEMACALVLPRTFPESPGFTSFWIFDVRAYEPGFILGWIGCFWRICVQVWGDEQALLRAVVLDPLSSCKPLQSPSWRRRVHALELSRVLAQNSLFSKTQGRHCLDFIRNSSDMLDLKPLLPMASWKIPTCCKETLAH